MTRSTVLVYDNEGHKGVEGNVMVLGKGAPVTIA